MHNWIRPVIVRFGTMLLVIERPIFNLTCKPREKVLANEIECELFIQSAIRRAQRLVKVLQEVEADIQFIELRNY